MQLSAISSGQGFTGSSVNRSGFTAGRSDSQSSTNVGFTGRRENIDEIIALSDNEIRKIAYVQTVKRDNERRKNVNRLFSAVPLVGALSAGMLNSGAERVFGKNISGLAAKTLSGVKSGGYWAFLLGTAGAVGAATNAVSRGSDSVNNFRKNHPFITLAGQFTALTAAVLMLPKGAAKLYKMIKPEYIAKAGKGVEQVAEHINKLKAPDFLKNFGKTVSSHTPELVKNIGKTALAWAPDVTLLAAALASVKSFASYSSDFGNTYLSLKDRQHQLAQARLNELKSREV